MSEPTPDTAPDAPHGSAAAPARRPDTPDEAAVAAYLAAHPDFLRRHPDLIETLEVPHETGAAVSLLERQSAALRERNGTLRAQLDAIIASAERNDALYAKLLDLAGGLTHAHTLGETAKRVLAALREAYGAQYAALELFATTVEKLPIGAHSGVDPAPYAAVMAGAASTCLPAPAAHKYAATLRVTAEELGSAALLPLRSAGPIGVLVLGAADPQRFAPQLGTVFLDRFAALVGQHLAVHLRAP